MPFIEMRGVTKSYGSGPARVEAASGVDLAVEKGQLALVVGPSGAGKTTVLDILGGMERPDAGNVLVGGRDIARLDERALALYRRREVGFVFQFYNLIASLTARENVQLASEGADDPVPAEEALAEVGLSDKLDSFPAELSGGEQQRVSVARALAKRPRLVLADEPTGALDFENGRAVLSLMQRSCREGGATLIVITHNLAFTLVADRVVRMASGRVEGVEDNPAPADALALEW